MAEPSKTNAADVATTANPKKRRIADLLPPGARQPRERDPGFADDAGHLHSNPKA
jgi:hypothetical protein